MMARCPSRSSGVGVRFGALCGGCPLRPVTNRTYVFGAATLSQCRLCCASAVTVCSHGPLSTGADSGFGFLVVAGGSPWSLVSVSGVTRPLGDGGLMSSGAAGGGQRGCLGGVVFMVGGSVHACVPPEDGSDLAGGTHDRSMSTTSDRCDCTHKCGGMQPVSETRQGSAWRGMAWRGVAVKDSVRRGGAWQGLARVLCRRRQTVRVGPTMGRR